MATKRLQHKVLIVSGSDKVYDFLIGLLPTTEFSPIARANSAGEAKRMLLSSSFDLLLINTPLPDEFGLDLALDMCEATIGIMLLVKNDMLDQVTYKAEDRGIFTVAKPNTKQTVYSAVKLLTAMTQRLKAMEQKTRSLQDKMADIRAINRAKLLLIENLKMNEQEAHHYIEKQAMNLRAPKREIAENIIRTYDSHL